MNPNDENGLLPPKERPFRVFVISGSQRRQYNPREGLIDHKNPEKAMELERSPQWKELSQNHYGGVEVPDDLWTYVELGRGKPYGDNQAEDMIEEKELIQAFDQWTERFKAFVEKKGKVTPGTYRAFGYKPPSHLMNDVKLKWREARMALNMAPDGSSPKKQADAGLNKDATFHPKESTAKQQSKRTR